MGCIDEQDERGFSHTSFFFVDKCAQIYSLEISKVLESDMRHHHGVQILKLSCCFFLKMMH